MIFNQTKTARGEASSRFNESTRHFGMWISPYSLVNLIFYKRLGVMQDKFRKFDGFKWKNSLKFKLKTRKPEEEWATINP